MKSAWAKRFLVTGLAVAMTAGGATSAFAKGKDKDDDRWKPAQSWQWNNDKFGHDNKFNNFGKKTINIKLEFDDVKGADVEWALRYIASLAAKGVFQGYEDGTFQPRKPISRIEAITAAVRLMGLEEQAQAKMNADLNFKDAEKVEKKYGWAVGYVQVALENDLFLETETMVEPEKPADRLWATMLLVKALKLTDEAKAKMGTKLPFRDAKDIPAGAVGYVAVAVEKGLIDGYEDNTFRPNKTVTRAELAALLDRTENEMPESKDTIKGTVTAAVYNNTLTLQKNGQTLNLNVDPNAFVFKNGVRISLDQLQPGDAVKVRHYNNLVIFIEVTGTGTLPPQAFTVSGTLLSTTLNTQGRLATITAAVHNAQTNQTTAIVYPVADNVTLVGDVSRLQAGKTVELSGVGNTVNKIVIK
ncbi:S-layer homology domain-containing protein [Paenibacillus thermoaerophilus]|uniref:S-layer homology domain-containing protein n=1 Tax=Paenibacillus thermoaerophilus TaxID=1215385 RepID=A0ABW2UYE5_9BACL|nr:S-layer homology domain-containing protein [Paenibacillus thermoaerophilus]TMV17740.1 S-layer homology domain-containing protein [Paenibacillus thermoaerophilus]